MSRPPLYNFDVIYNDTLGFFKKIQEESPENYTLTLSELIATKPYSRETFYSNFEKYTSEEFQKSHPELEAKIIILSDTRKKIKEIFEHRIVSGAMKNKYNPTFSIFNLKNNYGWKDKQEVESKNEDNITISWAK